MTISSMITGQILEEDELRDFYKVLDMGDETTKYIRGFTSVLDGNYMESLIMFETEKFKHISAELADALISISIWRWD